MSSALVCVCVCFVCEPHGAFYQCCFSIRLTEREAVAQNHFVPHKKLFKGIRWGEKNVKGCSADKWEQYVRARAHAHIYIQTINAKWCTNTWLSIYFCLNDTSLHSEAHTLLCKHRLRDAHTCTRLSWTHVPVRFRSAYTHVHSYMMLIFLPSCWCAAHQAGRPYTEMSAQQGAGKRGFDQWSPPLDGHAAPQGSLITYCFAS